MGMITADKRRLNRRNLKLAKDPKAKGTKKPVAGIGAKKNRLLDGKVALPN
jgi:hypothetical protein